MDHSVKSFTAALLAAVMLCGCTSLDSSQKGPVYTEILPHTMLTVPEDAVTAVSEAQTVSDTFTEETVTPEVTMTSSVPAETHPPDADPDKRYIYNTLSDNEKTMYDELKQTVENYLPSVKYSVPVDPDSARKVFVALYNNEPQLFWLNSLYYLPVEGEQTVTYRFDRSRAREMQSEIDEAVGEILNNADGMSDYEKIKYFHDHIVTHTQFSEDDENSSTIYGTFCKGASQCEGYAFAFDYLCQKSDIDCMTVTGSTPEGVTHAWNIVKLEGSWYNVDCTWDDPMLGTPDPDFLRRYYLLVSDSEILGRTHLQNDEYFTYPACTDTQSFFAREGLLAEDADTGVGMLKKSASRALSEGRFEAEVKFTSFSAYSIASLQLFNLGSVWTVISEAAAENSMTGRISDRKYVRYLNDDLYIIHITLCPAE